MIIKSNLLQIVLFTSSILFYSESFAQNKDSVRSKYIRDFPDYFNLKTLVTSRTLELSFDRKNDPQPSVQYEPNIRRYLGVGGQIFDVGLEVLLKFPKVTQKDTDKYGETKVFDLQGNLYGKKICGDAGIQLYKGFFISNPADYIADWNEGDNLPLRGDLKADHVFANFIYIFNDEKFSFRSGYNHADRQIKSAGSFIMTASLSYFGIMGDSSIIPSAYFESSVSRLTLNDSRFYTLGIQPGYSYNFVLKDFYVNLSVAVGLHIQRQQFRLNGDEKVGYQTDPKLNLRYAMGYDNDKFFAGISYFVQQNQFDIQPLYVRSFNSNFKVFAGMRIKKFGILKKYSVWDILEKIGLEQ